METEERPAVVEVKGGLKSYLPLLIAIVVMPVAAWVTFQISTHRNDTPSRPADTQARSNTPTRETGWRVPLTRDPVVLVRKDPNQPAGVDRIMVWDFERPRELAEPARIVVNLAKTHSSVYAVIQIGLWVAAADDIGLINERRSQLMEIVTDTASGKTLEQANEENVRQGLRSELLMRFNQILGASAVRDLEFVEFKIESKGS